VIISKAIEKAKSLPQSNVTGDDGVRYRNIQDLEATEDQSTFREYFLVFRLGRTVSYLLVLMSLGALGSFFRQLMKLVSPEEKEDVNKFSRWRTFSWSSALIWANLGMILSLVVVLVDESLLPEFKYQSGSDKFYYVIAFIGGVYTEDIFKWASSKLNGYLGKR
jgi:hypothetical protein